MFYQLGSCAVGKGRLRVQNCGSLATKGCRVVSRLHGFIDLGQSSAKHLEGFTKQLGEAKLQIEEYFYLPGVLDVSHFRRSKKGVQNCGCLATKCKLRRFKKLRSKPS